MVIQKGDQYAIPVSICSKNTVITPENCTDVRIQVNNVLLTYSKGEIFYNDDDHTWAFPLTQELSFSYNFEASIQIAVKFDDDYIYSPVQRIDVKDSIIKELWS